jgi:hypothetical protein
MIGAFDHEENTTTNRNAQKESLNVSNQKKNFLFHSMGNSVVHECEK